MFWIVAMNIWQPDEMHQDRGKLGMMLAGRQSPDGTASRQQLDLYSKNGLDWSSQREECHYAGGRRLHRRSQHLRIPKRQRR